jgi:hypothetical protein
MYGSWVRIPAGSQDKLQKLSKPQNRYDFEVFLFISPQVAPIIPNA